MSECTYCGESADMGYTCSYCGQGFCPQHRLPENHECSNLRDATPPTDADLSKENLVEAAKLYYGEREEKSSLPTFILLGLLILAVVSVFVLLL